MAEMLGANSVEIEPSVDGEISQEGHRIILCETTFQNSSQIANKLEACAQNANTYKDYQLERKQGISFWYILGLKQQGCTGGSSAMCVAC